MRTHGLPYKLERVAGQFKKSDCTLRRVFSRAQRREAVSVLWSLRFGQAWYRLDMCYMLGELPCLCFYSIWLKSWCRFLLPSSTGAIIRPGFSCVRSHVLLHVRVQGCISDRRRRPEGSKPRSEVCDMSRGIASRFTKILVNSCILVK